MVSISVLRKTALALPEVTEAPHFEKTSFRVGKKIFVTYDGTLKQATIKLSEIDQNIFSLYDPSIIFPVPNKWGKQGWTIIDLKKVSKAIFADALKTSYCEVAPKKLQLPGFAKRDS